MSHRIDNLMTAEQIKEHIEFILDKEFGVIRHEFKSDFFDLKYLVQGIIELFNIPGLIGEAAPYKTITEYIIESHKLNTKSFEEINNKMNEIESKQVYALRTEVHKLNQQVVKLTTNFDDGFKSQQANL